MNPCPYRLVASSEGGMLTYDGRFETAELAEAAAALFRRRMPDAEIRISGPGIRGCRL